MANSKARVVIVGAGFGGLALAKSLAKAPFDVTVVDRRNYHLFQPLLYQVATAGLSPADIAAPIRQVLRGQANTRVLLGDVLGVDVERREIIEAARRLPYDYLVLATGARHAYFGHDDWARFAPGLKTIDDATALRRRILMAFELAENEPDEDRRHALLTFVVVGGGPTGVEMAGAIAELARRALAGDFRLITPQCARILLVEAALRLLGAFPESLSVKAHQSLEKLGVEVKLSTLVIGCDEDGLSTRNERIDAANVIWAAGVMASPAAQWIGAEADRAGRARVNADLSIPGHPEIFVIGDTASVDDGTGAPLPGVAPVAKQQGEYLARVLITRARGLAPPPFRYRDRGSMATIGRKHAVAQIGRLRFSGFPAWLLWSMAHVYFLIGFRNRVSVTLNWAWNYVTFQRGTRLITGDQETAAARESHTVETPSRETRALSRAG